MSDAPRVAVTVSGTTGTGKSRILAEIEVALKAAGVQVEWATPGDEDAAHAEHLSVARSSGPVVQQWPIVVLGEVNLPHRPHRGHGRRA